ncbi:MAG: alpha-(1-_3)-arabinofuranosyltransferase family protein [Acidimicrobiia bacterium]
MTPRRWIVLAAVPLLLGVLAQRFGETFYLTRMERVLDPLTMARRGIEFWNPYWDMGLPQYTQNGYWLPYDLWFGAAHLLHIPPWIAERVFVGGLLTMALWGFVRLADTLRIGRSITRIVAGLAYATMPVILSRVGWQTPFAMGTILLPWVLVPLARPSANDTPRRAAARSAVAVALMGGANATVTLAALIAPLVFLLTRVRSCARTRLIVWWMAAVLAVSMWWIVGLLLFARFGADVLRYTESATITTGSSPIFEVLRGTSDWIFRLPKVATPAGTALALRPIPIVATALVTALGLAGLARRGLPERRFLLLTLVIGVAIVGGGFGGLFGSPVAGQYIDLLDGALNALRSVYKFQPLIALPVALGVAHALHRLPVPMGRGRRHDLYRWAAAAAVLLVVVAAWPLWRNTLTRGPGFHDIPAAWVEANEWLDANSPARTLVLPGIPDAEFDWGFTGQIPLLWGSDITWATRSQAPLGGADAVAYLDAVEMAILRGGDTALPDFLRRGGFSAVVVPNDQRSKENGAPDAEAIRSAMEASGFRRIASFGPTGYGFGDLRQIDVYGVPGGAVATTSPGTAATWLSGDVASPLTIPTDVFGDRAYLLASKPSKGGLDPQQWIITDGNQASTIQYGRLRDNRTFIRSRADDLLPAGESAADRTTREIDGIESVRASSVGPGFISENLPAFDPTHVLDGDPDSRWIPYRRRLSGLDAFGLEDPWVEVTYTAPRDVDRLAIALSVGPFAKRAPIDVTVTTDNGSRTTTVQPVSIPQDLDVAEGPTDRLRVAIARSSYVAVDDVIGISDLLVPGAPSTPRLVVPTTLSERFASPESPDPAWVLTRSRPGPVPLATVDSERQIARVLTVPKSAEFSVLARGEAVRGKPLLDWLGRTPTMSIAADSTLLNSPRLAARNLLDGNPQSIWRSDRSVTSFGGTSILTVGWNTERTIDSMRIVRTDNAALPSDVLLTADSEVRRATVAPDGTITFAPLTTRSLALRLDYAAVADDDGDTPRLMELSALNIPALADLYPGPIDPTAPYIAECSNGPTVALAGTMVGFSAHTTTEALMTGALIALEPCGSGTVRLPAGRVILDATSGASLLTIDQIVVGNPPTMAPPTGRKRSLTIDRWDTSERTVVVGGGDEGLLIVNENYNDGWRASLAGTPLKSMTVDGWRQGFVLPAGEGGDVQLVYGPERIFRIGTGIGVLLLLVVIGLAIAPMRRRRTSPTAPLREGEPPRALLIAIVAIGAVWCTGIGAVLLAPLWWLRTRHRGTLAPLALVSMAAAGVLVVLGGRIVVEPTDLWGAASYPVSALASLALLSALVTLVPLRSDRPRA